MLSQEALDLHPRRLVGPVMVSDLLGANDALTIDQDRNRQPENPELASDLHVRVEQHREGEAKLLDEVADLLLCIRLDVDGEELKSSSLVLGVDLLHRRHLQPARGAPGSPEIDQHHLPAAKLGKPNATSLKRLQRKVWCEVTRVWPYISRPQVGSTR